MARICVEKLILQAIQFRKLQGLPGALPPDPPKASELQGFAPGCSHEGALMRESGPHRTVASLATLRLNSSCQLVARIYDSVQKYQLLRQSVGFARSRVKLLQIFCHRLCPADSFSHYETGFALNTHIFASTLTHSSRSQQSPPPPPHNAFRSFVGAFGIMSFDNVSTKYLKDQQNIARNSSFLI